jgi:bacteriorhodopsin
MIWFIWIVLCAIFLIHDQAFGYIDPGTGSVVFSALGYILASAAAFLALFLRPLKHLISKLFKKDGTPSVKGDDSGQN